MIITEADERRRKRRYMLHEVINTTTTTKTTTIIIDAEDKEGNVGTCVHTTRGISTAPVY